LTENSYEYSMDWAKNQKNWFSSFTGDQHEFSDLPYKDSQ